jgi:hypothetical protein
MHHHHNPIDFTVYVYVRTFSAPIKLHHLRRILSSGILCRVPLIRTDLSGERIASIIRVTGDKSTLSSQRALVASYC